MDQITRLGLGLVLLSLPASPARSWADEPQRTFASGRKGVFLEEALMSRLFSFRRAPQTNIASPRTWAEAVEGVRQAVGTAQKIHFSELQGKARAWTVRKEQPKDLAILGGKPAFEVAQRVGLPTYAGSPLSDWPGLITEKLKTLHNGQLVNGSIVRQLENRLRQVLGASDVIATNSGSTALLTAIRALGMSGKMIVVPDLTFAATSQSAHGWNARLALGDTEPGRATLSPEATRALLDRIPPEERGGVLVVGLWGQRPDLEAFAKISQDYGIPILIDAAQALGTDWLPEAVARGMVVAGSFSPTKKIGGAGGGWIATHDAGLAQAMRRMAHDYGMKHGRSVDAGSNFRLTDDSAAMALKSLDAMDRILDVFQKHYALALEMLQGIPGLSPALRHEHNEEKDYQYFLIKNDPARTGLTFEQIRSALEAENIFVQAYYPHLLSEMPAYDSVLKDDAPHARELIRNTFAIPLNAAMQEDDIRTIFNVLSLLMRQGRKRPDLPRIGLGTAGWSPTMRWPENTDAPWIGLEEIESIIMNALVTLNPLLFDTALSYPGAFERVVTVLKNHDLLAQSLIIGKGGEFRDGETKWTDYSADALGQTARDLVRIAGRPLDAFLVHMPSYVDPATHLNILRDPATRSALELLRQQGLMRWIGVSISDDNVLLRASEEGLLDGFDIVEMGAAPAIRYSPLVESLGQRGIAVVVNSPRRHAGYVKMTPEEVLRKLLNMPGISTVLIGPKSVEELGDTLTTLKSAHRSRLLTAALAPRPLFDHEGPLKILFAGQHFLGESCLEKLLSLPPDRLQVVGVVTNTHPEALWSKTHGTYLRATAYGLPILSNALKDENALKTLIAQSRPDLFLSVNHPWLLSQEILNLLRGRALNLHTSLLPAFRGFHGANHAIAQGAPRHGVTLHWMESARADEGAIALQRTVPIEITDTAKSLRDKADLAGEELFDEFVTLLRAERRIPYQPTRGPGRLYKKDSLKVIREDPTIPLDVKARALYFPPFPLATILIQGIEQVLWPGGVTQAEHIARTLWPEPAKEDFLMREGQRYKRIRGRHYIVIGEYLWCTPATYETRQEALSVLGDQVVLSSDLDRETPDR
jgi:dTDP-4-amino-4,6-dideoxygalactose transaminase/methionyl-tRNA formyltransferase/diketogulonate reductase-like aldo/keto reductase